LGPEESSHDDDGLLSIVQNTTDGDTLMIDQMSLENELGDSTTTHQHPHNHKHNFPTGEVTICIGFFVFYCIGIRLNNSSNQYTKERGPLLARHKTNHAPVTVCCSSTRCPSDRLSDPTRQVVPVRGPETNHLVREAKDHEQTLKQAEKDCVLLLNRHHQHHTHNKHHEHPSSTTAINSQTGPLRSSRCLQMDGLESSDKYPVKYQNYGTVSGAGGAQFEWESHQVEGENLVESGGDFGQSLPRKSTSTIVVDEIRIISPPPIYIRDSIHNQCWPNSIKMFFLSLFLAALLILFDMNILGLLRILKLFRAACTGALLYIAFFILLPNDSAGCNSCQEEEG